VSKNNNWKLKYYLALNYAAIQRDADAMQLLKDCADEPDYAPFYLTRAAFLRPQEEKQELSDLLTAQKLAPEDWRTIISLIGYYETHRNNEMALSVSADAFKKHKDNSEIGIKYAVSLINNGQYANGLKVLEGMNILPSEGSRQGKIVFEQACLFLAMDKIKNKKYSDAIKMIEKSKDWPENLGVGKPYDVDIRIQDYLKLFCLQKLNRVSETEALYNSIIDYTNQKISAPSFSNILAIWLLKEKGDKSAADNLMQKMQESTNPVNMWVAATVKNDQLATNYLEKDFANNTSFKILKQLAEVTKK
jgi:tetratricopeptide (TPR) repeat protein